MKVSFIRNGWCQVFILYEASTAYGDSAEAKDHTRVSEEEEKVWKKINKSLTILFEF